MKQQTKIHLNFLARPPCPDCASMGPARCKNSARIFGVTSTSTTQIVHFKTRHTLIFVFCAFDFHFFSQVGISAFDPSLPGVQNRTEDCILETIGKPVFKRLFFQPSSTNFFSKPVFKRFSLQKFQYILFHVGV